MPKAEAISLKKKCQSVLIVPNCTYCRELPVEVPMQNKIESLKVLPALLSKAATSVRLEMFQ